MNLEGPRPPVNTKLTSDDLAGLRRAKPPSTSLIANQPSVNTHLTSGTRASRPTEHDKLVKQTQTWVAQTFFGTLMKQMRESPFKSELFDGGRGGEAFGSLYDQHLAERMSRGAGHHLVDSIVRRIESHAATVREKVNRRAA